MNRVHWTPNLAGIILIFWLTLWLCKQYLLILKDLDNINDLIRVGVWAIAFMATPFLIWRFVEFITELIFTITWKLKK